MLKSYLAEKWEAYLGKIPGLPAEVIEESRISFYFGVGAFLVVLAEAQRDGLKPSEAMKTIRLEYEKFMAELKSAADMPFSIEESGLGNMNLKDNRGRQ
jgi:hypothetical protein